jgi:hypothetical protein
MNHDSDDGRKQHTNLQKNKHWIGNRLRKFPQNMIAWLQVCYFASLSLLYIQVKKLTHDQDASNAFIISKNADPEVRYGMAVRLSFESTTAYKLSLITSLPVTTVQIDMTHTYIVFYLKCF